MWNVLQACIKTNTTVSAKQYHGIHVSIAFLFTQMHINLHGAQSELTHDKSSPSPSYVAHMAILHSFQIASNAKLRPDLRDAF